MAQQRLTHAQGLETQKLTGSQAAEGQRQADTAARQQALVQSGQTASSDFYKTIAAMTASGHDLAKSSADRGTAWIQPPRVQQAESNLPLILGLLGGGAVFLLIVTMMIKSASSARGY
jgi:hypothetical protein